MFPFEFSLHCEHAQQMRLGGAFWAQSCSLTLCSPVWGSTSHLNMSHSYEIGGSTNWISPLKEQGSQLPGTTSPICKCTNFSHTRTFRWTVQHIPKLKVNKGFNDLSLHKPFLNSKSYKSHKEQNTCIKSLQQSTINPSISVLFACIFNGSFNSQV